MTHRRQLGQSDLPSSRRIVSRDPEALTSTSLDPGLRISGVTSLFGSGSAGLGLLTLLFWTGCAVSPPRPPAVVPPRAPSIRVPVEESPIFEDDFDTSSLRTAALQSLSYYRGLPPDRLFSLASDTYAARDFAESLEYFVGLLEQAKTSAEWKSAVQKNFQAYQSIGIDDNHTVVFSAYYEPTIPARLKKSSVYRYPIYGRPEDLVDVDLGLFDPIYQGARIAGRRKGRNLVPYFTRGDIDSERALAHQRLEIAWAKDPADIFFLQIEGSGWLDLGVGAPLRIRYDGTNGRRYQSVGQYLIRSGRVKGKALSHAEFARYLKDHPKERQEILNVNERYVFFRTDISTNSAFAFGNIEVPLTPGRSMATDPKLFPKGLLAWISTDKPLARFMLNQDEGGAIQGPGRVDFFAGHDRDAERFATHFWQKGKLYFLVRRRN